MGIRFFIKNDHAWMGYQLILSNLKFVDAQFLVIVYNDTSCHVTLGDFQRWTQWKNIIWRNKLDIWWESKDYSMCQIVQNNRVLQENKARQIFWKTNNSYPLIRTLACTYQGIRNVRFSENFMCFVFFVTPVLRFALLSFYLRFLHCLFLRPPGWGIGKLLIN